MNVKSFVPKKFFYRQHPDAALRYLPIVRYLKKNKLTNKKILELGSGSYGITPYLNKRIVGVDVSFDEPEHPLLEQVKGSVLKIPFADNEFDIVLLSDVLEHIPPQNRKKALNEIIRVARFQILLIGPFGKKAFEQDKELARLSRKKTGKMHHFLKEHLEYGLPEITDVRAYLKKNPKVTEIQVVGNYLNLTARKNYMKFFISKSKLSYYFYLKGLMFLVPLLSKMNKKPCYRSLLKIQLRSTTN